MQEAFRENHGLQCGFCTPGMVMAAVDMVNRKGNELDEQTIRQELDGNLCRCTGYHNIVKAIAAGAKAMKGHAQPAYHGAQLSSVANVIGIQGDCTMYAFKYHRPTTVRQAANLLAKFPEAKLLAGGHSLIPVMKLRLGEPVRHRRHQSASKASPSIELKGRSVVIGAMARHVEVANSQVAEGRAAGARRACPARSAIRTVRHRGTIGGSVANNDPNADYPAAVPRPRRHHHHQQAPHRRRRFLQGHVRDRARARRDHHQGAASRSPRRRPTRSSSIRPRASRWSACSCRSAAPTSASR